MEDDLSLADPRPLDPLTNFIDQLSGVREVDVEQGPSSLTFSWKEHGVRLTLDGIREDSRGIVAEVSGSTVKQDHNRPSTPARIDLLLPSQRNTVARYLQDILPLKPDGRWKALLDDACYLAIRYVRQEEPIIRLTRQSTIAPPQFRLTPLVYERLPTVMFTGPGVAKSYVSLFLSMLVQSGSDQGALSGQKGEALYIDFESDVDDFSYRAERIRRGHPELSGAEPNYLRCHRPLVDSVTSIQRHIEGSKCKFVVIDSLGPACGQDLDRADTAIQFFAALRSLKKAVLIVAHQPKSIDSGRSTSIFGSTFFNALARSSWELQKEKEPSVDKEVIRLKLVHRKANLSRLLDPISLSLTFGEHSARFATNEALNGCEASLNASIPQRILQALTDRPMKAIDLAERLTLTLEQVKPRLTELKNSGAVRRIGGALWMKSPDKSPEPRRTSIRTCNSAEPESM